MLSRRLQRPKRNCGVKLMTIVPEPCSRGKCRIGHEPTKPSPPLSRPFGERPASWWRSCLISDRRDRFAPLGSIPPLSAHLLPRRLAALRSTSLAHVTGLASSDSAAACICSRSASVIGISMADVLRSLGFLGGLPIRLFSIPLNIYRKSFVSTLALPTNSVYNKYSQRKTPGSVGTRPGADSTGFRLIEPR